METFKDKMLKSDKLHQILLLLVALALSVIVLRQFSFAYTPLLWAIVFYLSLKPIYRWLIEKKGWRKHISASLLVLALLIFIFLFLTLLYLVISAKIIPILNNPQIIKTTILSIVDTIHKIFPVDFDFTNYISNLVPKIANSLLPLITNIGTMFLDIFLTLFIFYILLINNENIRDFLKNISPFSRINSTAILNKFEYLVRSNAIAIPLVAITQGTVAIFGYWIFGISLIDSLILGFLTAIGAVIPVVGPAIVYIPVALFLAFINGNLISGICVLLWGLVLVSTMDNVFRAIFQKRMSGVSNWYTIIGSIVGLKIFGISGLVFGPILLIAIVLLWKLYYKQFGIFGSFDKEEDKELEADLAEK